MIVKTEKDIKSAIKGKATTVACVCNNCNTQYTISVKKLKEFNKLLCRKCFNIKNKKQDEIKRGYLFNDLHFVNSKKLAYYIWLSDNNKSFLYKPNTPYNFIENDKEFTYIPDFLVEGRFIEIIDDQFFNEKDEPYNNYKKVYWWEKYNIMKSNNIYIMRDDESYKYLKYVNEKYGKNYLKSFKILNN